MIRPSLRRSLLATTSVTALTLAGLLFAQPAMADVTNGGFETGTLSGWTTTGTTTAINLGAHSGTYTARVGGTSPTNGNSSIAQTFTAPGGSPSLSFWYDVFCPDTVTYDWATATLKDNTSGTTTTPLTKTCTSGQGWKQKTAALTAGHSYTLTLISKDDNYAGDPTYTLYDDIVVSGTVANDFSISDSPASATVNAGSSATSTISTAVVSGTAETVNLSASGLPSGASAAFSPASVTAGSSSTLTITTATSTPSGTYPITVTGTSPSATHSAAFTLTVNGSGAALSQVSTDPFTNTSSQHATELEPDTFAYGNTIVASSQVGRFTDGGSSDIGWNTSTDGGATWQHGMLPGITVYQGGGSWARVSDPAVAYDARHGTWMVSGLVIDANANGAGVTVSRSSDGLSWQNPVLAVGNDGRGYDKEWIVCDNTATSPHYGNCYVEVDITSSGNAVVMSTSSDGGATWSAPVAPSGGPTGLGGQPLVQPNGTVVVPYSANGSSIQAFNSANGGTSWSSTSLVANVSSHGVAGGLRDGEGLPSAEIDASGKIYIAWQDCRFRSGCPANDIVYSTSTNGTSWSAVTRVPIDATSSTVDHFIPGIGIDHATSGTTARIGLYYYFYPQANCTASTCQLEVGFLSSTDGGTTWSTPQTVAGPMSLSQIASTTQGSMVGDYMSTSVVNGKSVAVFAVGKAPTSGQAFDEALYTAGALSLTGGTVTSQQATTAQNADASRTPRQIPLTTLR
ncbi:sialidase family protein [Streptomyces sp. NBC_01431]|uniref:sialidase family protein n=1 Tax=Streptomyces sp. NBC_01431 TaxID=2903863 RepID=UPI002E36BF79|nr:sialidase family protein [Streptomyces sp. NBC_01431]